MPEETKSFDVNLYSMADFYDGKNFSYNKSQIEYPTSIQITAPVFATERTTVGVLKNGTFNLPLTAEFPTLGKRLKWKVLKAPSWLDVSPSEGAGSNKVLITGGNATNAFTQIYRQNVRKNLYLQALPKYFEQVTVVGNSFLETDFTDVQGAFLLTSKDGISNLPEFYLDHFGAYSYHSDASAAYPSNSCLDYSVIAPPSSFEHPSAAGMNPTWNDAFGLALMDSTKNGGLGLSQDFLFDRHVPTLTDYNATDHNTGYGGCGTAVATPYVFPNGAFWFIP